jgi:hypothetical protein
MTNLPASVVSASASLPMMMEIRILGTDGTSPVRVTRHQRTFIRIDEVVHGVALLS